MVKVGKKALASAIEKSRKISLQEKEFIVVNIQKKQPHLLASVLVLQRFGCSLEQIDVLLHILLVCHVALVESGVDLIQVSEDEQDKQMTKLINIIKLNEKLNIKEQQRSMDKYIDSHPERLLLAFAYSEMSEAGFLKLTHENSKYLIAAGLNLINCIEAASVEQ